MTPNATQRDFLALHVKRTVLRHQWHLCETQLRAHSAHRIATLDRAALDELIDAGLMEPSGGVSVRATEQGRAWLAGYEQEMARSGDDDMLKVEGM